MISRPRRTAGSSDGFLREPLGPAENRRERIVELVRDAGNGLAERGHLLGLQELVIDVARLVVQLLAFADVAHQSLEAEIAVARTGFGARRDLDPDGRVGRRGSAEAGSPRRRRR